MKLQWTILWSDALVYMLVLISILVSIIIIRNAIWRAAWRTLLNKPVAMFALMIILAYAMIGLLDSIHFHPALPTLVPGQIVFSSQIESLLDILVSPLGQQFERTYSAPFALALIANLSSGFIIKQITVSLVISFRIWVLIVLLLIISSSCLSKKRLKQQFFAIMHGWTNVAWRSIFLALAVIILATVICMKLSMMFHILGTDQVGQDVFYQTIKSIRTGLIIGTLTTLFMLPFAIFFGTIAGYFRGWIDDIVQYVYITLSSIPGVLLITASVLVLQIFIKNHPQIFPNLAARADARLLILCAILGVTSWTDLCRLLRGETLKLREMEFTQAALVMGVGRFKIIWRHILPNIMHIILITAVLDFSTLVLAEAVLSYVGVGVDPSTISWGNMINSARMELARDPVVWWPLGAAFIFMFVLVFAANVFADAMRDAFDPRLRG